MVVVSSTFSPPVDGVLLTTPSTKLLVNDQDLGTATLYITESNVVWGGGVRPTGGAAPTISLLYPTISLHAIQREPSPALFLMVNYDLSLPELNPQQQQGGGDANDDDDDFDAEDEPQTTLRFIPENENDLQAMYTAMKQGQTLHPDPQDVMDDMDDMEDPYMDGEEFDEGDDEFEDAMESNMTAEDAASRMRQLRLENGHHTDDADDAEVEE